MTRSVAMYLVCQQTGQVLEGPDNGHKGTLANTADYCPTLGIRAVQFYNKQLFDTAVETTKTNGPMFSNWAFGHLFSKCNTGVTFDHFSACQWNKGLIVDVDGNIAV